MPDVGPLAPHIERLRAELGRLLQATAGVTPRLEAVRASAAQMSALVDALSVTARGEQERAAADSERLGEVLEAIYAVASLDFSKRAEVRGDGPIDALATSINMLAEELDEAQARLAEAKASAEAATVAKSRFLAQMSHEIRTPLTAILGFTDMLCAPTLSESDRLNYAMIVRRNGEHLLALINDILDLSRIEAQKLQVEVLDCSPAAILNDVESLMRVRATERQLDFEVRLETPIPATVRTDPTRLRQVLLNVVGNAIKFTERGSVRVLARYDARAGELAFTVVDTGMGMTPEQLSRLFQPFEQADLSMTRRFGGSGLGLAISFALMAAMGGSISAESSTGAGSRFTIRLPVPFAEGMPMLASLATPTRAAEAPVAAPTFEGQVLLAEDGPDNQVLISTILRKYGLTVSVAQNGAVAVDQVLGALAAGTPFDLVFMDMQMPVLDGYEATRRLRSAGYGRPIAALTAHAMEGELERCLAAGCDAYVRKPIERANLHTVLERFLKVRTAPATPPRPGAPEPLYSELDDPDMAEIVAQFVATLPKRGEAIREAARTNDPLLPRLVHQLKGAAGGYGFPGITAAAARLEKALRGEAGAEVVAAGVEELASLCDRARGRRS